VKNKMEYYSTGVPGIDEKIKGLNIGDNVVWQIDSIDDYRYLAGSFAFKALDDNRKVVYFRFASHEEILPDRDGIERFDFDPGEGFESFTSRVNYEIERQGKEVYYVFDCLSELLSSWANDLMIGNFFMVICPRLFELETIAYFSVMRNSHSDKAISRIRKTTQLLIDAYRFEGDFYIHPLKVENRYSHTMFLPHLQSGEKFKPVTDSVKIVKLFSNIDKKGSGPVKGKLDYWDRLFIRAGELADNTCGDEAACRMRDRICSMMISENPRILSLAKKYLSLKDLLEIKDRFIGTGFIGGKSAGMLLARKILSRDKKLKWDDISEAHDSFYVGSDIFNSYIVENKLWKLHMKQKNLDSYFKSGEELQERLLKGFFPDEVKEQFQQIVEYFGASPVIVRSSSLLEDAFGNAFAGKYESIFCANRGTPSQRYEAFEDAVRKVYASTMSRDALTYRKVKNLHESREQMALLVQRVSGSHHKRYFFPDAAGVGFSHNTYVWNEKLSPDAGMLRIVFGLGTRAVNRVEGDYPRMAALDNPGIRPYSTRDDFKRFSQRKVDLINIEKNSLSSLNFLDLSDQLKGIDTELMCDNDYETARALKRKSYPILTLNGLLKRKDIVSAFRGMLKTLEKAYEYPVEIEFTLNFGEQRFFINLLQCRPLQTKAAGKRIAIESASENMGVFFKSRGNFIGGNVSMPVERIIYVNPRSYMNLNREDKYETARIIGRLNRVIDKNRTPSMLIGPGRWGTTTPSLGVCVNFYEINNFSFLIETALPEEGVMPEFSFGTHFFQDIVEADIFYAGLSGEEGSRGPDRDFLNSLENTLSKLLPRQEKFKGVIGVYDVSGKEMKLLSDIISRKLICVYRT